MKTIKMIFITLSLLVSVNIKCGDAAVKANHKKTIFEYIGEVKSVKEEIDRNDEDEDSDNSDDSFSTTLSAEIPGGKTLNCTSYSKTHKFNGIYQCSVTRPDANGKVRIAFYQNKDSVTIYKALENKRSELLKVKVK